MSELAYFRRRLAYAQRATDLPPTARFDLASSTVSDDGLEQAVEEFGGPSVDSAGFGMADILHEFLSKDPKYVPVTDIATMQERLGTMGYLPPGYTPTGEYDGVTHAAFRRSERDAFDLVRAGKHLGSTSVKKFFEYIGYTIPSKVIEGVFGMAKGIVDDIGTVVSNPVEVAEESGLAGGALTGGIAGGAIGSVVPVVGTVAGATAGAIIGGAAGFFGDLFDDEEPEEGNWDKIVSSLTPLEEIQSGDAKHFFAGLSTAMTASAALKAVRITGSGFKTAMSGPSLAKANVGMQVTGGRGVGGMVLPRVAPEIGSTAVKQAGLREAFRMAAPGTVDKGILNKVASAGLRKPVVAGATVGATVEAVPELLEGDYGEAITKGLTGAIAGGVLGKGTKARGINTVREKALVGLDKMPLTRMAESGAGKVARALYTGPATASIVARGAAELPGETAVEKGIEETDLGTTGDVLDWTIGSVIFPNRLLPTKAREVGDALQAMSSNHILAPFAELARQTEKGFSSAKEGLSNARTILGRVKNGASYTYDPSVAGQRAATLLLEAGIDNAAEAAARGKAYGIDPGGYLKADVERQERHRIIGEIMEEADSENLLTSPLAKTLLEEQIANPVGMERVLRNWESSGSTLDDVVLHHEATTYLQSRTREYALKVAEDAGGTVLTKEKNRTFTPALRDDPDNGVVGYTTKEMVTGLKERYVRGTEEYRRAHDLSKDLPLDHPLSESRATIGDELDKTLSEMHQRHLIDEMEMTSLSPRTGNLEVEDKVVKRLDEIAETRASMNKELTDELEREGMGRYIALETGDNMIFYDQLPRQAEINGASIYAKKKPFFDFLASMSRGVERADIGALRYDSIAAELEPAAAKYGFGSGRELADKIYDSLKLRYDVDYAARRGQILETKLGGIVKRTDRATMESKRELFKVTPNDLNEDDLIQALKLDALDDVDPYEAARKIKGAVHVGAAFGADVLHPAQTFRHLARSLRLQGLPGLNDFMRTFRLPMTKLPGEGKMAKFAKNTFGYLPQNLRKSHMAVQFALSPTFDASRYVEAMTFGAMKGQIPLRSATSPVKFIKENQDGWNVPWQSEPVYGEEAVKAAHRFADEVIYGRAYMQNFDELQYRLLNSGILGFKPREVESAQALYMYQQYAAKGKVGAKDLDEIREKILKIHQYGSKQTTFGNSMHFVFFPFLFQKKQIEAIHEFVFAGPARNLLVHEGFRRWYQLNDPENPDSSLSTRFNEKMQKHLPIAKELERLNNLSYGIGAGRFFLEGMMDRSTEGKVAQGLASFFLPGGVHQPVAESVGKVADTFKHAFAPVVLFQYGERITPKDEFFAIAEGLVPMYRDIQRFFDEEQGLVTTQLTAVAEGMSPQAQYTELADAKRVFSLKYEEIAKQLGYDSWDSLRASDAGAPLAAVAGEIDLAVGEMFPSGAELSDRFSNADKMKARALYDIQNKDERTDAEEAILALGNIEQKVKDSAEAAGVTQEEMLRSVAPVIREFASGFIGDRQFNGLWEALFQYDFGPLRRIA